MTRQLLKIAVITSYIAAGVGLLFGEAGKSGEETIRYDNSAADASGKTIENESLAEDLPDRQAMLNYLRSVPVTRWPETDKRKPVTYEEWKAGVGEPVPFEIDPVEKNIALEKGRVGAPFCIIINSSLYPDIESSINQYLTDLIAEGYDPEVYTTLGGSPEDIRSFLQTRYASGLVGCILIGDLPIPWFETNCWIPLEYEAFPIDLYYMDMDGIWDDEDSNGIFDLHEGNTTPEIWVGRLTASPMIYDGADEVTLVQGYFVKNHIYRTGQRLLNNRALVYIDDDWIAWAGEWSDQVALTWPSRTLIYDGEETQDFDYEARLAHNYESILLCAHSSPFTHSFKIREYWTGGTTHYYEVKDIDPAVYFYNLFACSNARYVEYDYMAGWYIFCDTYGVVSLGSTKIGSMLLFEYFYESVSQGKSYGEAFYDWFNAVGADGFTQDNLCWFYGMTLCGDPTLRHIAPEPLVFSSLPLSDALYGYYYRDTLEVSGGVPPYHWEIIEGSLPPGFDFGTSNGLIIGTCTQLDTYYFTVVATDNAIPMQADTQVVSIKITFVCGDADNNLAVNMLDILLVISYLYKSGPAPVPPEAADADGSGTVNMLDILCMISYLYKGGPVPVCQ